MNQNEAKSSDTTTQTEYRIYEHPVLKRQIVKRGFSLSAMIIGPAWLLFKKLWGAALLFLIFAAICYAILHNVYREIDIVLFGETVGDLFTRYGTAAERLEYRDWAPEVRLERLKYAELVLLFLLHFLVARIGNALWEKNLVNRGYELKKTVQARTRDEVTAILARRKDFSKTTPAS